MSLLPLVLFVLLDDGSDASWSLVSIFISTLEVVVHDSIQQFVLLLSSFHFLSHEFRVWTNGLLLPILDWLVRLFVYNRFLYELRFDGNGDSLAKAFKQPVEFNSEPVLNEFGFEQSELHQVSWQHEHVVSKETEATEESEHVQEPVRETLLLKASAHWVEVELHSAQSTIKALVRTV